MCWQGSFSTLTFTFYDKKQNKTLQLKVDDRCLPSALISHGKTFSKHQRADNKAFEWNSWHVCGDLLPLQSYYSCLLTSLLCLHACMHAWPCCVVLNPIPEEKPFRPRSQCKSWLNKATVTKGKLWLFFVSTIDTFVHNGTTQLDALIRFSAQIHLNPDYVWVSIMLNRFFFLNVV